ncbi:MAG TPA: ATP-binding protein [Gemmatimonadaceae bacterium]|nr:ATP-binding protein [Gemmatimonadaceae bacterium]
MGSFDMFGKKQPLDRKLPLVMSVLVLATVGLFAGVGYWQFGNSLYSISGQRLTSIAALVSNLVAQGTPRWRAQMDTLARNPAIIEFLESGSGSAEALAALDSSNPTRSRGRWRARLLDARGRPVLERMWHVHSGWPQWAESTAVGGLARGQVAVSPIFAMQRVPVYELLVPVHRAGSTGSQRALIGYVADTRAMVESQAAIRGLIGDSVTMLLGQRDAGIWTDLQQPMPRPPARTADALPVTIERSAYGAGIGVGQVIPGTPWEIWLQQPRHLVLGPVHDFLWRMVPIGALITVIGALLVWIMSHRIAHRIVTLTGQAEQIVPEDATSPQPASTSRDEVERLSDAFDRMSTRVATHQELEGKLRQAQKLEAVGRLAGGIAHDFNNILTVIRNYTEFVREELPADSPVAPDIKEILTATDRASALTGQLLAFSRNQVVSPKVLDLNEVVRETENMLRRLVPSNIELSTSLDEDMGHILADRGQIEQVLLNLTINAADAMPEGGTLTIRTQRARLDDSFSLKDRPVKPGRYASIVVTDTGTGIDRDTMIRIFDPFFTTKEVGKGTGLGLATVHGIATQNDGHVRVYSELGHGATFKVYLPEVTGEVTDTHEIAKLRDQSVVTETILLAEDDEQTREVTRRILARRGYTVLEAHDGTDALSMAQSHEGPIHLVLSDMMMPGLKGGELAERLRAVLPEASFLLMSGYTGPDMQRRNLNNGSLTFIEKPFTQDTLLTQVRASLDGMRSAA